MVRTEFQKVWHSITRLLGSALVCVSLGACGSLTTTDLTQPDLDAAHSWHGTDLKPGIDALVGSMVEEGHMPGAVVGVLLPDGTMRFYGYGVTDQSDGRQPDGDTLFAVGSLSKGFLGAMTALLVEQGKLSWSDTLEKLLPPGLPLSPDARKTTLLQLATHTSGMPRQPLTLETLTYFGEYLFTGETFYKHFTRDYVLDYLSTFEPANPGQPRYSNIGYGLLGYIVERRSHHTVDQLLARMLVRPLHLKCTGYEPKDLSCYPGRALGHAGDQPKFIARGERVPDWEFTPLMRGAAAMWSNARDLLTFASAHVHGKTKLNRVLASDLAIRVPKEKAAAAISWVVDDVEGEPIDYQIGIVAGYTSYLGIDPTHKTAVVILQNAFNWDNSMGHKLLVRLRNWPN
jgi:CubicO group peptidase (beta-lactamase class C family)